jgi:predicted transcriptional regulator
MSDEAQVTVADAVEALGLTVLAGGEEQLRHRITGAMVSDLLSFVMAGAKQGDCWITVQTHPNIVAVAALGQLPAIMVASGFDPEEDTVARAEDEGIPLLTSSLSSYELAGRLYALGIR